MMKNVLKVSGVCLLLMASIVACKKNDNNDPDPVPKPKAQNELVGTVWITPNDDQGQDTLRFMSNGNASTTALLNGIYVTVPATYSYNKPDIKIIVSSNTATIWFKGTVNGDSMPLTSSAGDKATFHKL